jgi:hypothetical protein
VWTVSKRPVTQCGRGESGSAVSSRATWQLLSSHRRTSSLLLTGCCIGYFNLNTSRCLVEKNPSDSSAWWRHNDSCFKTLTHMAEIATDRTIAGRAELCSELFRDSLEILRDQGLSASWIQFRDQFGRFNIWCSSIGVFASLHASMDYRLRDLPDARDLVIENLDLIVDRLQQRKSLANLQF